MEVTGRLAHASFCMARNNTRDVVQFVESFRPNQIKCKKWLVDEIANYHTTWNNVLVLGSWNACLLYELMNEQCKVGWWDFIDTDILSHDHRDQYFETNSMEKNYSAIVENAESFSAFGDYDLIINCSCEHMKDIPPVSGPLYALQSNNYDSIPEHTNTCVSEKDLWNKSKLTDRIYQGELDMGHYNRYMVLGFFD